MNAAGVTFMGGPADGKMLTVPADESAQPAPGIRLQAYVWENTDGPPTMYFADYRRTVNPADDGPLWVYLFTPGDADAPVLSAEAVAALDPSQVVDPGPGR